MSGMSNAKADGETKRVVWILAGIMLLSFAFGTGMFIPDEHRAEKLEEMMQRYQQRNSAGLPDNQRPAVSAYIGSLD
jgi:hypothetical protein